MKNEMKSESGLGKIVENLDVLVPLRYFFIDGIKQPRKKLINGIYTLVLACGYLPLAIGFGEANPLKIPSAMDKEYARRDSVKAEAQVSRETFSQRLYQKVAGEDGVIDSTEFTNFYEKIGTARFEDFYNKE